MAATKKSQIKDLLDFQLGRLKVVAFSHVTKTRTCNSTFWICKCECGNAVVLDRRNLLSGRVKSCGCLKSELAVKKHWKGVGDMSMTCWWHYVNGARSRSLEFTLSIDDCWDIFVLQGGRCAISGAKLSFQRCRSERNMWTASLDRIDSRLGYVPGNVQWVHKVVNIMKSVLPNEEFIRWCHMISSHQSGNTMFGEPPTLIMGRTGYRKHFLSAERKTKLNEQMAC